MGFWSSLCSGISSACSAIGNAVKTFISVAGPVLEKINPKLAIVLTIISVVVQVIGALADILKPEEDIEDMGERALQAEEQGITLDSCDGDFEEYSKQLREIEIDPDKIHSKIDRLSAGILFVQNGIDLKYPNLNLSSMYPLMAMNKEYFNENRLKTYFNLATEVGYNFEKLSNYFSGTCSAEDAKSAGEFIVKAEQKIDPNISSAQIQKQTDDIKKEVYDRL